LTSPPARAAPPRILSAQTRLDRPCSNGMSHWNWTKREMSGTCRGGHATGASPGNRGASLTTRRPGVPLQSGRAGLRHLRECSQLPSLLGTPDPGGPAHRKPPHLSPPDGCGVGRGGARPGLRLCSSAPPSPRLHSPPANVLGLPILLWEKCGMSWKKLEWTSENGFLNLTPLGWDVHKTLNINDPLLRANLQRSLSRFNLDSTMAREMTRGHRSTQKPLGVL